MKDAISVLQEGTISKGSKRACKGIIRVLYEHVRTAEKVLGQGLGLVLLWYWVKETKLQDTRV